LFHPDQLPVVETNHWELLTYLDHDCGLIESEGYIIGFRKSMDCPYSLQPIVKHCLMFKGYSVPNIDDVVLSC